MTITSTSKSQEILTCGKSEELSPNSKHSTEQAFVRGEPKDVGVYDLPAIVSLVQVVTACFLFHIVPAGGGNLVISLNLIIHLYILVFFLQQIYRL